MDALYSKGKRRCAMIKIRVFDTREEAGGYTTSLNELVIEILTRLPFWSL